jgi:hypothetical protein
MPGSDGLHTDHVLTRSRTTRILRSLWCPQPCRQLLGGRSRDNEEGNRKGEKGLPRSFLFSEQVCGDGFRLSWKPQKHNRRPTRVSTWSSRLQFVCSCKLLTIPQTGEARSLGPIAWPCKCRCRVRRLPLLRDSAHRAQLDGAAPLHLPVGPTQPIAPSAGSIRSNSLLHIFEHLRGTHEEALSFHPNCVCQWILQAVIGAIPYLSPLPLHAPPQILGTLFTPY